MLQWFRHIVYFHEKYILIRNFLLKNVSRKYSVYPTSINLTLQKVQFTPIQACIFFLLTVMQRNCVFCVKTIILTKIRSNPYQNIFNFSTYLVRRNLQRYHKLTGRLFVSRTQSACFDFSEKFVFAILGEGPHNFFVL